MRQSSYSFIIVAALFSECCANSALAPWPKGIPEEGRAERGTRSSLKAGEGPIGNSLDSFTSNWYPFLESSLPENGVDTNAFLFTDAGTKVRSRGFPSPALSWALPLKLQTTEPGPSGTVLTGGRRSTDEFIPVGRRDFDVLRCMVGRVYRPCWQA